MNRIDEIQKEITASNDLPQFSSGDTVAVSYKIKEGNKERIQQFQGVVIQRREVALLRLLQFVKCQVMLV